ncbi:histone-like nucleoid-structuring protein Lsr2 [Arthrobacter caoxuetaonis]|uniref:Lsr2 family protein n=1 Tax=Arthrobacter caoxuetaonis TaxID=2886935 RepID=A0A9X1SE23_9MICC|nr:Lsr2 family protein [Arthrobacter caoxuetaonis]MCC3299758.1 Lsr2 family protein [Arthrobacter caoxuetaonis]USQ59340.1 Lsr2 family protein [Arthrobacter caoxuetaonis]
MAQKIIVTLQDDLDGSQADETIRFALEDVRYEIDLNSEHAKEMRDSLAPFIEAARKVQAARGPKPGRPAGQRQGPSPSDVREWAKSQGMKVNDYGRVPQALIDSYVAAN